VSTKLNLVASTGNIPNLEELPTLRQARLLIHHRLREYIAAGRTLKSLAERAHLHPTTVSRAAYHVTTRTTLGTIHALAPHLGIRLDAKTERSWKP
jgi:DNA-binding phage protein